MKKLNQLLLVIASLSFIALVFYQCTTHANSDGKGSSPKKSYLDFPEPLTVKTPYDVDSGLQAKLTADGKFAEVQRLFEILSWQFFISLNWPTDASGQPKSKITDPGDPIWYSWKESFEVFRSDGSKPWDWGKLELPEGLTVNLDKTKKVLFRTSKVAEFHYADSVDEIDQAFTAPIWDQSGNIVRYEVRMNKKEFNYIVANELYNLDGQIAFSKSHPEGVDFPKGSIDKEGVFEVKIAWKIMQKGVDDPARYFTTQAYVIEPGSENFKLAEVGMIGMHISTKTETSPQWIWTTFEHVDNLETNALEEANGKPLKPSFYDPDCATCPVNTFPDQDQKVIKNQIQRVLPISEATQQLNGQVHAILAKAGSKLQYYDLIGAQWPTDPESKPYPVDTSVFTLPESVSNKSGGMPTPVYLTNMIMETYFQGGTITSDTFKIRQSYIQGGKITYEDTLSGFNVYNANEPAFFQMQGFPSNTDIVNTHAMIFGTESCIGCHYSASIATGFTIDPKTKNKVAVFGNPQEGDFSWLLQLKAHFKEEPTP
ncbi:hypothetical protein [Fulvivirga sediminis]|uniref:Cytochrome c domain-containing protein n=1 Tax=Fulvivirga sediminis TaxID=2803949 RepID=A0A937FBX0_9BACT|nr:hypothetical protein [Fulvivirga sediminis]MBL3658837.1 hypothetical protein [Fulvivirga sediminis]